MYVYGLCVGVCDRQPAATAENNARAGHAASEARRIA